MQALKLKGKVDEAGKLIISESINLAPGEVEIIIWQSSESEVEVDYSIQAVSQELAATSDTSDFDTFMAWLKEGLPVFPTDFDADESKWQYLKEKHDL
ncbi:MAG: hypothetical protein WA949_12300 [Phormidesmis sp.]